MARLREGRGSVDLSETLPQMPKRRDGDADRAVGDDPMIFARLEARPVISTPPAERRRGWFAMIGDGFAALAALFWRKA